MLNRELDNPQVVGTGFTTLDRVHVNGMFAKEELGGSCGNVLVSLALLRHQVAPLIVLGQDDIGGQLVDEFARAGADIRFITQRSDIRTPIVAQDLCTSTGQHSFSFKCKKTNNKFPRYFPVGFQEVESAGHALDSCSIFYVDRLSSSILVAMERAHLAGALIFFEPSAAPEIHFERALELASIVKYSSDRLGSEIDCKVSHCPALAIITHGSDGLEIRSGDQTVWQKAVAAETLTDTSGCGDMVSLGLIDWLLSDRCFRHALHVDNLSAGILAGQHLAAANCAFTGARGLFRELGPEYVRRLLRKISH